MKIIFICASNNRYNADFLDYSAWIYTDGKNCTNMPLALPTLAALTPSDIEVKIINENNIGIEVIDFNESADIVGITCVTYTANRAYEIAEKFRERGVYVAIGGVHVSNMPNEAGIYADSVFIGEAEETWPQFIEDFRNNQPKPVYKAERYPDLQTPVIPRWDLINKDYPALCLQTTRGCPFKCEYCAVRAFQGKPRQKPITNVLAELRKFMKHTVSNVIYFADDNIIGNKKYAIELFNSLISYKVQWLSPISIDIADDEELMDLAKKSGAFAFMIGIESINQASLTASTKPNPTWLINILKKSKRYNQKELWSLVFSWLVLMQMIPRFFKKHLNLLRRQTSV